ncbi:MAG: hypothetical protein AABZ74_01500 [Cyanobacteriota bacterium]
MLKSKIFKSLFAIALPLLVFATPVKAASEWEWKDYNVQFALPDDMKVTTSTGDKFLAEAPGLSFEIYPWKDAKETAQNIAKEAFATLGKELEVDPKTAKTSDGGALKINEYDAYLMEGEGKAKDGGLIYAVIGLIDPKSEVNFAAYVYFYSEDKDSAIKNAIDILMSIKKMKK